MGSPPFWRQPHAPIVSPPNAPPGLTNHPPVPVNQFLGLPHHMIEHEPFQPFVPAAVPPPVAPLGPAFNPNAPQ
ncbi:hypothetical protein PAXRUDRAFT_16831 [Paxillus rubicundulus Ve08.2h10]|uniref:Uncharacterized protein n=1 Tax=Paxillus rubicundulus Ve08.2h10 TaxID=930991 RepID=A0A0D0CT26_9AGAM|nr:hypothetical protein PAXRUDRAFT_16831 [Paxillus rubicundulus Ve08.2h10]